MCKYVLYVGNGEALQENVPTCIGGSLLDCERRDEMGTSDVSPDDMSDEELTSAAIEAADYALTYEMTEGQAYREQSAERSKWQGRRAMLRRALKARGLPIPPMKNTGL